MSPPASYLPRGKPWRLMYINRTNKRDFFSVQLKKFLPLYEIEEGREELDDRAVGQEESKVVRRRDG